MLCDWESTTRDVAALRPELAVIPFAASEQHGAHLPVGAKVLVLDAIARRVAQKLPGSVYLLPTVPAGASDLHRGTPGTVSLGWQTLAAVLRDLIDALLRQGIRKVVVFAGLGDASAGRVRPSENQILKTAVRQLNYDHPELRAVWLQPFSVAATDLTAIFEHAPQDLHAGEVMTSIMLHLAPDLVKGRGKDYVPGPGRSMLDYVSFTRLCPAGVWGYPTLATAEKGVRALEAVVDKTASAVVQTFDEIGQLRPD
jgi:creatinine amidohydrolase